MIFFRLSRESKGPKGYFAGFVQTAFYIGRVFGSLVIGRVADKTCKYSVLKICLVLSAVFIFAFGFTLNIYFIIVMRFLIGMVSGISIIDKSLIYDICNEQNQSVGMLFYGIGVSASMIVAPLIGGYLQNPAKLYPTVFSNCIFFIQFPYLLPSVCVIGLILVKFLLVLAAEHYLKNRLTPISSATFMTADSPEDAQTESTIATLLRIFRSKKIAISLGIYMLYSLVTIGFDELFIVFLSTQQSAGGLQ